MTMNQNPQENTSGKDAVSEIRRTTPLSHLSKQRIQSDHRNTLRLDGHKPINHDRCASLTSPTNKNLINMGWIESPRRLTETTRNRKKVRTLRKEQVELTER